MGILCRFVLFFYSLAFAGVSLIVMLLFSRILPDSQVWNEFLYLCSRWETLIVAIIVFLLSIYLFIRSISFTRNTVNVSETFIVQGSKGDVTIAISALKDVVDKISRSVAGVRDANVKIQMVKYDKNDKILLPKVNIILTVSEDVNVVFVTDQVKEKLSTYLKDNIGINDAQIDIRVKSISNNTNGKNRVI